MSYLHTIIFFFAMILTGSLPIPMHAADRALLIGIGNYDTKQTGWRKIHGDSDIALLTPQLKKHGFNVISLVNSQANKQNIVQSIKKLAKECKAGDRVYLHFSGHGQPVIDCNDDEAGEYDEAIVPYDAYRSEGYAPAVVTYHGENHLIDDELSHLLEAIRDRIGAKGQLFVVFDACYSRGLEKGDNDLLEEVAPEEIPEYFRGVSDYFIPTDKGYLNSIKSPAKFKSGCVMAVVSACRENERNFEYKVGNQYYGVLSYCLYRLMLNNIDFSYWINYFQNGSYKSSGCFLNIQHPTITIYK